MSEKILENQSTCFIVKHNTIFFSVMSCLIGSGKYKEALNEKIPKIPLIQNLLQSKMANRRVCHREIDLCNALDKLDVKQYAFRSFY